MSYPPPPPQQQEPPSTHIPSPHQPIIRQALRELLSLWSPAEHQRPSSWSFFSSPTTCREPVVTTILSTTTSSSSDSHARKERGDGQLRPDGPQFISAQQKLNDTSTTSSYRPLPPSHLHLIRRLYRRLHRALTQLEYDLTWSTSNLVQADRTAAVPFSQAHRTSEEAYVAADDGDDDHDDQLMFEHQDPGDQDRGSRHGASQPPSNAPPLLGLELQEDLLTALTQLSLIQSPVGDRRLASASILLLDDATLTLMASVLSTAARLWIQYRCSWIGRGSSTVDPRRSTSLLSSFREEDIPTRLMDLILSHAHLHHPILSTTHPRPVRSRPPFVSSLVTPWMDVLHRHVMLIHMTTISTTEMNVNHSAQFMPPLPAGQSATWETAASSWRRVCWQQFQDLLPTALASLRESPPWEVHDHEAEEEDMERRTQWREFTGAWWQALVRPSAPASSRLSPQPERLSPPLALTHGTGSIDPFPASQLQQIELSLEVYTAELIEFALDALDGASVLWLSLEPTEERRPSSGGLRPEDVERRLEAVDDALRHVTLAMTAQENLTLWLQQQRLRGPQPPTPRVRHHEELRRIHALWKTMASAFMPATPTHSAVTMTSSTLSLSAPAHEDVGAEYGQRLLDLARISLSRLESPFSPPPSNPRLHPHPEKQAGSGWEAEDDVVYTLTLTFLRLLEFPTLLLSGSADWLWPHLERYMRQPNPQVKHALQAAFLTLQQQPPKSQRHPITPGATTSPEQLSQPLEDHDDDDPARAQAHRELFHRLVPLMEMGVAPGTTGSPSWDDEDLDDDDDDPWDEFFLQQVSAG